MSDQTPTPKLYFWEPKTIKGSTRSRYYVYYIEAESRVQTLFDICNTEDEAESAITLHKQGRHSTQWTPGCGWTPS